jgi:hypothetical protein
MWDKILGAVTGPVATYLTRRMELKEQRHANDLAILKAQGDRQAQLHLAGLTADANWEMEFARQAQTSYKDEYTLAVVSIPAVLCFVKTAWLDGPSIVKEGFAALATTPLWFQLLLCTMFAATVGVRWWRRTQSDT